MGACVCCLQSEAGVMFVRDLFLKCLALCVYCEVNASICSDVWSIFAMRADRTVPMTIHGERVYTTPIVCGYKYNTLHLGRHIRDMYMQTG